MAVAAEKIVLRWRHITLISLVMSWWTEHLSDKNRKKKSAEQAVRRMQKMKLGSAFAKLKEVTVSPRESDTCISACATLWEGLVKFVSLCAFLLLILSLDSAVCNFLQISCSWHVVLLSRELLAIQRDWGRFRRGDGNKSTLAREEEEEYIDLLFIRSVDT